MIVCQCNVITQREIVEIVEGFLNEDAWQVITIGMVYHAMEKRGKCCGCFPNAIAIIVESVEAWHRKHLSPENEVLQFVSRTRDMLHRHETMRTGRPVINGHKAA